MREDFQFIDECYKFFLFHIRVRKILCYKAVPCDSNHLCSWSSYF
jgi:hypothetical protein